MPGIRKIYLSRKPLKLRIRLSSRVRHKVVKLSDHEFMVAFNGVKHMANIPVTGSARPGIKRIKPESLPNHVEAVFVFTGKKIKRISSKWSKGSYFEVGVYLNDKKKVSKIHVKPKEQKILPPPKIREKEGQPETNNPPETKIKYQGSFKGEISDFLELMRYDSCASTGAVREGVDDAKKGAFGEALITLTAYIDNNPSSKCLETAFYLRSFCDYMKSQSMDNSMLLDTANGLQDTMSYYPESRYMPFVYAELGKIQIRLGNKAEARGYFKIIMEKYKAYQGMPQVIFEMAMISIEKKKYSDASSFLQKIVSDYPDSEFTSRAVIELAKTYFNLKKFSKAIVVLKGLLESKPRLAYESSDILVYIGNSFYQQGKYKESRKYLAKAYNLFPGLKDSDIVLSRIADSYVDEKEMEKAKKIYQLVIKKYPGTDGFVISSMRLARLVPTNEEKEKQYKAVIEKFSDHPMANLARLRLAELQQKDGEFGKSIDTADSILQDNKRTLRKEAVFLKISSYEKWFKKLMDKGDYPLVMSEYEKEKTQFNRYENPLIFYLAGKAFFRGHLYSQAAAALDRAYKSYSRVQRPKNIALTLGLSLKEAGKYTDALEFLSIYLASLPARDDSIIALKAKGTIYMEKKEYKKAAFLFKKAAKLSVNDNEKAGLMVMGANALDGEGNQKVRAVLLASAIRLYSSLPEKHFSVLSSVYKKLGDAHSKLHNYLRAADSFSMALKFSGKNENKPDLKYLLGRSYKNARMDDRAAKVYQEIIASGDPFWGGLAREEIKTMNLVTKLKNT